MQKLLIEADINLIPLPIIIGITHVNEDVKFLIQR